MSPTARAQKARPGLLVRTDRWRASARTAVGSGVAYGSRARCRQRVDRM
jgi:hypothetical protein